MKTAKMKAKIKESRLVTTVIGTGSFSYSIWCACGNYFQMEVPKSRKNFRPRCPRCGEPTVRVSGDYTRRRFL